MTFQSVSSNGAQHGILLDNTGSTAGLTVTGTGAANSGGTIQNTTSHGVMMTSTQSPSFTSFRIMNTGGSGVRGTGVTHFTYVNGSITGSNDDGTAAANESNIAFHDSGATVSNLAGNVTITGNSLTNALFHGIDILNHAGTVNSLNLSGNTITSLTSIATAQGSGIRLSQLGSGGIGISRAEREHHQQRDHQLPQRRGHHRARWQREQRQGRPRRWAPRGTVRRS